MSSAVRIAATAGSPTTRAATIIAPSARARGGTGPARCLRGRSAAGRLLPPILHAAGRDCRNRLSEQGGGLRPAVLFRAVAETLLTTPPIPSISVPSRAFGG